MKTFSLKSKCVKCGSGNFSLVYHEPGVRKPYLRLTCSRCSYSWDEAPLNLDQLPEDKCPECGDPIGEWHGMVCKTCMERVIEDRLGPPIIGDGYDLVCPSCGDDFNSLKHIDKSTRKGWYCVECDMVAQWAPRRQGVSCECEGGFDYTGGGEDLPDHWIRVYVTTIVNGIDPDPPSSVTMKHGDEEATFTVDPNKDVKGFSDAGPIKHICAKCEKISYHDTDRGNIYCVDCEPDGYYRTCRHCGKEFNIMKQHVMLEDECFDCNQARLMEKEPEPTAEEDDVRSTNVEMGVIGAVGKSRSYEEGIGILEKVLMMWKKNQEESL